MPSKGCLEWCRSLGGFGTGFLGRPEAIDFSRDPEGDCRHRERLARLVRVVPGVDGWSVQGDAPEEALANVREAIEPFLETLPVDGRGDRLST